MNAKKVMVFVLAALLCLGLQSAVAQAGSETTVSDDPGMMEALANAETSSVDSRPFRGSGSRSLEAMLLEGVDFTKPDPAAIAAMKPLGGGGAESILAPDTRVQTYTTTFPARATVLITNSVNNFRCSGFLIGSNTVVTAGHCVHSGGSGGTWYSTPGYRVYAGASGTFYPYGSCTVKGKYSVTGWTVSKSELYDYGVLKLNCTVGNTTGWYGFFSTSGSLTYLPAIIPGYPGDKPTTQWWAADTVRATYTDQIFYRNDTFGGMSGSPVWYDRPGVYAMAIHGYGIHGTSPHSIYNHGKRITSATYTNLLNWKSLP